MNARPTTRLQPFLPPINSHPTPAKLPPSKRPKRAPPHAEQNALPRKTKKPEPPPPPLPEPKYSLPRRTRQRPQRGRVGVGVAFSIPAPMPKRPPTSTPPRTSCRPPPAKPPPSKRRKPVLPPAKQHVLPNSRQAKTHRSGTHKPHPSPPPQGEGAYPLQNHQQLPNLPPIYPPPPVGEGTGVGFARIPPMLKHQPICPLPRSEAQRGRAGVGVALSIPEPMPKRPPMSNPPRTNCHPTPAKSPPSKPPKPAPLRVKRRVLRKTVKPKHPPIYPPPPVGEGTGVGFACIPPMRILQQTQVGHLWPTTTTSGMNARPTTRLQPTPPRTSCHPTPAKPPPSKRRKPVPPHAKRHILPSSR